MTHDHATLATHVAIYKRVRQTIADEFGLETDDEAVLDTAAGETDLEDVLIRILRASRLAAAEAKGIGELQKQMAERKARKEAKAERLKAIVLNAMADAGLPKLAAPEFSASRGRSQPPLIVPEGVLVPDEFCRVKREPDKPKIAAALKEAHAAGRAFDFAYFGNGAETLTVRSM